MSKNDHLVGPIYVMGRLYNILVGSKDDEGVFSTVELGDIG